MDSQRIFIVEDNEFMRRSYDVFVRNEPGMETCGFATNGEEALASIPDAEPNLVVIDMSLPDTDGIKLVRQLRERYAHPALLIVSGHEEEMYAKRAIEAGADGYVMKGDAATIMKAMHHVLGGKQYLSDHLRDTADSS